MVSCVACLTSGLGMEPWFLSAAGDRCALAVFFFSSRRRHTRCLSDWSSDVCSSDLGVSEPTKAQWMPNLSVSEAGTLFATWYDETPRTSASCQPSSPTNLCYQMHSRRSEERRVGKSVDLGGRRIIKKKKMIIERVGD